MPHPHETDLFESIILDHTTRPRHFDRLEEPTLSVDAVNPVCGDRFRIELELEGMTIKQTGFSGRGCALSKASTSMMVSRLRGIEVGKAVTLRRALYTMLTSTGESDSELLQELEAFSGVREHPSRIRCVMIAWDAVARAITPRRPD